MYKFDRLEFPKKYPQPGWIKLVVMAMIVAGIGIHYCSQKQAFQNIDISDVRITGFSRVHVEVEYTISNNSKIDREIWLFLQVYGQKQEILGNSLYSLRIKAGNKQELIKIIDKLTRPLDKNERPSKATLEVYKRKVL